MLYKFGDLLEAEDIDAAVHCVNLYHTFGSGIALAIGRKYPEVYEADKLTPYDDETKLGYFSKAAIDGGKWIYNLYAMWGLGNNGHPLGRNLSYDHFYNGVYRICEDAEDTLLLHDTIKIGLAYGTGCVRAGGSWHVVESILWDIEAQFPHIEFVIYELEEAETVAQSTVPWEL